MGDEPNDPMDERVEIPGDDGMTEIDVALDPEVNAFFEELAELAGVTKSQALSVILASEVLKRRMADDEALGTPEDEA